MVQQNCDVSNYDCESTAASDVESGSQKGRVGLITRRLITRTAQSTMARQCGIMASVQFKLNKTLDINNLSGTAAVIHRARKIHRSLSRKISIGKIE